jgi:hypothetical protein
MPFALHVIFPAGGFLPPQSKENYLFVGILHTGEQIADSKRGE